MADRLRDVPLDAKTPRPSPATVNRFRLPRLLKSAGTPVGKSAAANEERCAAIAELGGSRDERAADLLVRIVADDTEPHSVREAAVKALAETGDSRTVPLLVALLDGSDPKLRGAAVTSLGSTGDRRIVKPLIHYGLEHPHEKYLASDAILRLEELASAELLDVFNDREPGVVLEAVVLAGRLKDARAVPALIQTIETRSALFRSHAAESLGQIGDRRAIAALVPLLGDADPGVRVNAASALEKLPDPNAVKPLLALLRDEDADVRIHVIHALGAIGDQRAAEPLSAMLADPSTLVQVAAADALGQCGDERAVAPLLRMVRSTDETMKLKAISSLRRLKDTRAAQALLSMLHDPSDAVRQRVVDTLGHIGDADVAQRLEGVLKHDRSEIVRVAAAKSLGEIRDPGSVEALIDALQDDFAVRCRAVVSLGMIGDESAVPAILAMLRNPAPEVRFHAAGALAELAPSNAAEQLRLIADDTNPMVRRGVAKALQKLGDPEADDIAADSLKRRLGRFARRGRSQLKGTALGIIPHWLAAFVVPRSMTSAAVTLSVMATVGVGVWLVAASGQLGGASVPFSRGMARSVALRDDAGELFVARTSNTIERWDCAAEKVVATIGRNATGPILWSAGSPLLLIPDGAAVQVWNTTSEKAPGKALEGHASAIVAASITANGRFAATMDASKVVIRWRLPDGEMDGALQLPNITQTRVFALSADGTHVATADNNGTTTLWDIGKAAASWTVPAGSLGVFAVAFSPDGGFLAHSSEAGLKLIELGAGTAETVVAGLPSIPSALAYSRDGRTLAAICGNVVCLVDPTTGQVRSATVDEAEQLTALAFAADGTRLAVVGEEHSPVWLIDVAASTVAKKLDVRR